MKGTCRKWMVGALVIGSVILTLPLALVEGLYRYGVARGGALPDSPSVDTFPEGAREALWLGTGEAGVRTVKPLYPWNVILEFVWMFKHGGRASRSPGFAAATVVARHEIAHEQLPGTHVQWALATWARTIWLTRHMNAEQLVTFLGKEQYFGRLANDLCTGARVWFGKPVDALGIDEVALLVAMTRSPGRLDPVCHGDDARLARNHLLTRLADSGSVTPETAATMAVRPIVVLPGKSPCGHGG